jgi:V8-like Glu-specific endopeptidase
MIERKNRITFFTVISLLINYSVIYPQDFVLCPGGQEACGPASEIKNRKKIEGAELNNVPNLYIVHQEISRGSPNYSTGAFIAPNMILTAHHNVYKSFWIRKLAFCNKSVDKEKWIRFKRKEVTIFHFKNVRAPTDISVIVFEDPKKIAPIYKGSFKVGANKSVKITDVHLTGFPCDFPDMIMDRTRPYSELKQHKEKSLLGYSMYTCTGDSGAPLWGLADGEPTIIGIHHGGGEGNFEDGFNCSAEITTEVMEWLKALGWK